MQDKLLEGTQPVDLLLTRRPDYSSALSCPQISQQLLQVDLSLEYKTVNAQPLKFISKS